MKKLSTILVLLLCLIDIGFVPNVYGQAVALPYSQDFSTANDFTFVNGSQTNIWNYGTAVGNPGGSIYISNNSGTANAYTTGSPSISHAYKDFIIPAGSTLATFSFDWRAYGESTYDYLRVWLVPATYTPTAGTAITAAGGRIQVGAYFNQISAWQTYTNYSLNVGSFAGNTMRLVYEWTNDDSFGTQPPAAVDNISLLIPTCVQPSAPVTSAIGANTATIAWTAPTVAPGNGYEYYLSTTNTAPTAATTGTAAAGTSVILPSLTTSTTYYWWVRSVCSATDKSVWLPGGNFTTTQIPATLPYSQDFTTNNDFGFTNGTYTNKWAYGNAAGNPAGAIYISNDNGTTNAYTLSSSESTVHAYRDITIPAGTTTATFSFDWKGVGESTYDYLKVWLVPVSYTPTAGTLITAGSGRIQVGPDYINLQSAWQNYMNPSLNISSFAGTTMRLVFQWRNDGSGGSQPPIAVDNVNLFVPSCNVPTALTVSAQTSNGASLAWTAAAPAPGNGYEYYLSTTNTAPTAATVGTAVTGTTATPGGLASYTTYYWWVRSICSSTNKSIWIPGPAFTTGQIGTGTGTSGYLPIYSYYGYNYSQQIYTKAELVAAVGANNYITAVRFYVATPQTPQANYNQWVVYLGNTTQTTFASNTNWIPLANLTQVYSGTLPNMTAGTWVEIPLSTPFIWDGDSNIVVAVDENSPGYSSSGATWGSYTAGSNRGILYYADGTNPNPASPPSASNRYADIPRIQFKGEPLLPCSTNPPANIAMGVVTASTATVTWTPAIGATYTIRYRVQGTGAWTTAGTVVSPGNSITIPGLTEQTTYEVQIATTCSGTQGSYSPSTVFTTPPLSYCNMTGNGADYIANVTVTSANVGFLPMSNTTLQTNYTSYNTPATLINLDIGSTGNQISVAKGWTGSTYSDAVTAWIDFNRNGTFEDSERILISAASTTTPVAAYFDVPATAYNGPLTTTMRVISRRTSAPVMCQTPVDNGEVEDYAVRLRPCSTVVPNTPTFTLTTHNSTTINWTAVANVTYQVRYRKQGPPAGPWEVKYASTQLANIPLLIDGLDPATIYDVQIATVCGSNVGTYSPITSFTTRCDPTPPSITISNITTNSASVTWAPLVPNSTYIMRYRIVGTTTWTTVNLPNPPANTYPLSGLDPYTSYEVQIANQCVGETTPNPWSNPKVFTTERTCELPPPGLTITNLTPTTAVVVWDFYPGATYILRYRKVGIPSWTNVPVSTNTYTITGLLELTKYEMQVVNVCNGTPGTYTPPYYFTTPTVIYCQMQSQSGVSEYISNVTVKPNGKPEMTNDSNSSNYSDYTGNPLKFIELIQGSTGNQISVAKQWQGTNSDVGIAVWIDFDRSGTFDINERILAVAPNQTTPVNGTFSVPADAFVSMTDYKYVVMRVALQKGSIPVNCTSFAAGEVEDYTVRISKNPVVNTVNQTDIMIYPNPVSTILYVKNISKKANYKIYNAAGQLVSSGLILNNNIDVRKLVSGVYVIDIDDVQGKAQKKFIKE